MMNIKYLLVLLVVCGFSSTASAMRCQSRLVSEGDVSHKFRALCGQPSQIETRVVYRTVTFQNNVRRLQNSPLQFPAAKRHGNRNTTGIALSDTQAIQVEEWHYNFGPRRFMRKVTFENGVAQSIELLGYGY